MSSAVAPANTPPIALPGPAINPGGGGGSPKLPFRRATTERCNVLPQVVPSNGLTANYQPFSSVLDGTGFIYSVSLRVVAVTSANAATVAFTEDGPYNALGNTALADVNGQVNNFPNGWYLWLSNLLNRLYANRWIDQSTLSSQVTGSGGTGGSFTFYVDVPVSINRRDLTGILPNQDRAQKYTLTNDISPSSTVYSTPPTTLPTAGNFFIDRLYENYSVPMPIGPNGVQQQLLPDSYGTLHQTTVTVSESVPSGSATVNHYLRRIGNTIRWIAFVFRSNGSRATADTNAPTLLTLKVGDDTLFVETYFWRRKKMYERFGFDLPSGILVYDNIHDFDNSAGYEVGNDLYHTQGLVNAQLQATYPSGFGSTNNSLTIMTSDLIYSNPTAM